jgi:hypothetical protein
VVRTKANTHWHVAKSIILDTETHSGWVGLAERHELPAAFKVEYFRVWRKVGADVGP